MAEQSTIRFERKNPQVARIIFSNPPVNLVVPETVVALSKIVRDLEKDPDIKVVVFAGDNPDFFINHFDGAAAGNLPVPENKTDDRQCQRNVS